MSTIAPRRGIRAPYVLIVPAVVILLAGMGYPLIWQFVTSMQEYGLAQQFGEPAPFVGFDNFVTLATDPVLWTVVARSLAFCVLTAAVTLAVGTLLALLMTVVTKTARLILQIALLLAWSMPVVAAMTVWIWLFDRRRGVVNYLLDMIPGVEMNRFDWLSTPLTFFAVASIIVIWMSVPFVAFSIYAGLTQVSDEVLEAAQLDGANGWNRFFGIRRCLLNGGSGAFRNGGFAIDGGQVCLIGFFFAFSGNQKNGRQNFSVQRIIHKDRH